MIAVVVLAGCGKASVPPSPPAGGPCYAQAGRLADTLYLKGELPDATPPRPRPPHLAPYPPAAGGDFMIRFRGADYLAFGMPILVTAEPAGELKLVRIGHADRIPVFTLQEDVASHPTVLAPITEECVFLPFKHRSEMSGREVDRIE